MFSPHLTVAAVIESNGRFLLVEERVDGKVQFNQPAGHIEANESIIEALYRETLEETGCDIEASGLVGLYQWQNVQQQTFFRYAFSAKITFQYQNAQLDPDIIATHWFSLDEIQALEALEKLRSPLVLACINDYLTRPAASLSLIKHIA